MTGEAALMGIPNDADLIALFRARAATGTLYLDADQPDPNPWKGMWQALCAWEAEQNPAGEPTPLRTAIHRITSEQPDTRNVFAVRTTEYGGDPRHG